MSDCSIYRKMCINKRKIRILLQGIIAGSIIGLLMISLADASILLHDTKLLKDKYEQRVNTHSMLFAHKKLSRYAPPYVTPRLSENNTTPTLNMTLSEYECSYYKFNETITIYINVTDASGTFIDCDRFFFYGNFSWTLELNNDSYQYSCFVNRLDVGRWSLLIGNYYGSPGTFNVTIEAYKSGYQSAFRTVIVHALTYDHAPPTIQILSPANGTDCRQNNNSMVEFSVVATDDFRIYEVEIFLANGGGYVIGVDRIIPDPNATDIVVNSARTYALFNLSIPPSIEGVDYLIARVTDCDLNVAETNISVIVDGDAPDITILSPKEGEIFTTYEISLEWTAQDYSPVVRYELYVDGQDVTDYFLTSTTETHATVSLPPPNPSVPIEATWYYTIWIYAYDMCNNVNHTFVNIGVHAVAGNTQSTTDEPGSQDDKGNENMANTSSSWLLYTAGGGIGLYLGYTLFKKLSKGTIQDSTRKSKSKRAKAKDHVTDWRTTRKRR